MLLVWRRPRVLVARRVGFSERHWTPPPPPQTSTEGTAIRYV